MKNNTRKRGYDAELAACKYLLENKLHLIEKNYYCRHGEIDLIMIDNDYLVFIEVRHRIKQDFMQTIESIDLRKQKKIIITSQYFLQENRQMRNYDLRFDVVVVNSNVTNPEINWLKNAFQA